jgi:hypothetical protein
LPKSKLWVDICLLLLNTFPMTICFLKSELRAESYGPEKFRLFYSIYSCMLHVSYFSSCTFSGTHNQNMTPPLASMGHNISIDYSCAPNRLLSIELCPLEVILVPKFYPHCFGCNFLIRALFCEPFSLLDSSLRVILFEMKDKVYLGTLYSCGF